MDVSFITGNHFEEEMKSGLMKEKLKHFKDFTD